MNTLKEIIKREKESGKGNLDISAECFKAGFKYKETARAISDFERHLAAKEEFDKKQLQSNKIYFILLIKYEDGVWGNEFGSYERSEVVYEKEANKPQRRNKDMKILSTDGTVAGIQATIDQVNKEEGPVKETQEEKLQRIIKDGIKKEKSYDLIVVECVNKAGLKFKEANLLVTRIFAEVNEKEVEK